MSSPLTPELEEAFEGAQLADGFEEALIGLGTHWSHNVAVYDLDKCVVGGASGSAERTTR